MGKIFRRQTHVTTYRCFGYALEGLTFPQCENALSLHMFHFENVFKTSKGAESCGLAKFRIDTLYDTEPQKKRPVCSTDLMHDA